MLAAKEEIQTGRSIQLDWPMNNLEFPGFGRKKLEHKVIDLLPLLNDCAFDDEISVNTQCGSQWDSLKHVRIIAIRVDKDTRTDIKAKYAYQKGKVFYNGLTHKDASVSTTNGIHSKQINCLGNSHEERLTSSPDWCQRGGIVGRGLLVDMVSLPANLMDLHFRH